MGRADNEKNHGFEGVREVRVVVPRSRVVFQERTIVYTHSGAQQQSLSGKEKKSDKASKHKETNRHCSPLPKTPSDGDTQHCTCFFFYKLLKPWTRLCKSAAKSVNIYQRSTVDADSKLLIKKTQHIAWMSRLETRDVFSLAAPNVRAYGAALQRNSFQSTLQQNMRPRAHD